MTAVEYRIRLRPERRFEYVSDSVFSLVGYTPEEHYVDPDLGLKIVHPADMPALETYIRAPGAERNLLLRWVTKDGRVILTEHRIKLVRGPEGDVVAVEGVASEVPRPPLASRAP